MMEQLLINMCDKSQGFAVYRFPSDESWVVVHSDGARMGVAYQEDAQTCRFVISIPDLDRAATNTLAKTMLRYNLVSGTRGGPSFALDADDKPVLMYACRVTQIDPDILSRLVEELFDHARAWSDAVTSGKPEAEMSAMAMAPVGGIQV